MDLHRQAIELTQQRDGLIAALKLIADGPWPDDCEGPEQQCRFDESVARAALKNVCIKGKRSRSHLWAPKITLKSGKSWLYAHAIGFTRTEAKDNYLKSGRVNTDTFHGSKATYVKVQVIECRA